MDDSYLKVLANEVKEARLALKEAENKYKEVLSARAKLVNPASEEYAKLTYKGRVIDESKEMGGGYCGSCSLEAHKQQIADPNSWIHGTTINRWLQIGLKETTK